MASIVVPYRAEGKRRLEPVPEPAREEVALAMLEGVLNACVAVGETVLVTDDAAAEAVAGALGVRTVRDPGGGQGAAVAAALGSVPAGPVLVVNADVPCATARDLLALLGALPARGLAVARAADGTTNALALSDAGVFEPLYGPRSERRFREHAESLGLAAAVADIPNLAVDVDTVADLDAVEDCAGARTRDALKALRVDLTQ